MNLLKNETLQYWNFYSEERGLKKWIDPAKKGGNLAIKSMELKSEVIINNSLVSGFSFQMDPLIEQLNILPIVQTTLKVEKIYIFTWCICSDEFQKMTSSELEMVLLVSYFLHLTCPELINQLIN